MAINFRKIAEDATILSDLMSGREKVAKTDGIVTLRDFDLVPDKNGEVYAIFAISDTEFINGGAVLTKIAIEWVNACGDIATAREELRKTEGVTVKLKADRTKDGKNLTKVEVL